MDDIKCDDTPDQDGRPVDSDGHAYVGLVNQAMTCYLNSLLQALYMTPEFRHTLYSWQPDSTRKQRATTTKTTTIAGGKRSVAEELQRLFLSLQTSQRQALTTTQLTHSFGWNATHSWDQHDIQELWHVLLASVERSLSQAAGQLSRLYQGALTDYVICLACLRSHSHDETFNTLPLAVRSQTGPYKQLESAIAGFVAPETLSGDNAYFCEHCGLKAPARKGVRINRFPYLLTIQLKRFDFNYETQCRLKLNDFLSFSPVLNLNPFVYRSEDDDDEVKHSTNETSAGQLKFLSRPQQEAAIASALTHGAFVYELFVVMVHVGSANGGHYLAYIKNVDTCAWLCFDDESVTRASEAQLRRTFGGSNGNSSAYMLMYRQVDPARNMHLPARAALSPSLQAQVVQLQHDELQAVEREQLEKHILQIDVLWEPLEWDRERECRQLRIVRQADCTQLIHDAVQLFGLGHLDARRFRLACARHSGARLELSGSVTSSDEGTVAGRVADDASHLLLQYSARLPLPCIQPDGITLHVFVVDFDVCMLRPERLLWINRQTTAAQLQRSLAMQYGTASRNIRVVAEQHEHSVMLLDAPDRLIADDCWLSPSLLKCYVDAGGEDSVLLSDRRKDFEATLLCAVLDRYKHTRVYTVRIPEREAFRRAGVPVPRELAACVADRHRAHPPSVYCHITYTAVLPETDGSHLLTVEADSRLTVSTLRAVLADWICLAANECGLAKLPAPAGPSYDLHDYEQPLHQLCGLHQLLLTLGRPLQPGEVLLPVVYFDPTVPEAQWRRLFDVIASGDSSVPQLKQLIADTLQRRCELTVLPQNMVLRESSAYRTCRLRSQHTLEQRMCALSDPVSVEMVADVDCPTEGDCAHVFVRRFYPQTLECGAIRELHLAAVDGGLGRLRQAVASQARIPVERVLLTDPLMTGRGRERRFAYELDPLLLHDERSFGFDAAADCAALNVDDVDGRVLYYRDAADVARQLSSAERVRLSRSRAAQRKHSVVAGCGSQRRERALHIYATQSSSSVDMADD